MTGLWLPAVTAFLASAVEAVEALTIVLAVGVTQGWRVSLAGALWAFAALAAIVVVLGPAIVLAVPIGILRVVVGGFLLLFGLAWLRKAVQRYGGRKALRDERAAYARNVDELGQLGTGTQTARRVAFVTSFKSVLLEGLEVAVIVVTVGASSAASGGLGAAALGALGAVVLVALVGVAVRAPLARVPENALKFAVGVVLTSFGTYWMGEGLGVSWWHEDLSIVLLAGWYLCFSLGLAAVARALSQRTVRA